MEELLLERASDINVRDEFIAQLHSGKPLRVKFGIDPTGPVLHIGRASTIRQLKKFQDLGHQIVLIIGDFTGRIGDTSDKDSERQQLTRETIEANMATYKEQLGRLLDMSKVEFHYNSEWHDKLDFAEVLGLAQNFTVAQMIERENYAVRFAEHRPIGLHEFMYPLMQGYDSVAIKADIEIGGTDQLFNLMAGRVIQKRYGQTPQSVVTFDLLEGTDGRKMSTSWGNAIYIDDEPVSMYGKVMSIHDNLIAQYYHICTDIPDEVITALVKTIADGANPRDAKASLGREIVTIYHGVDAALAAEAAWNKQFREKKGAAEDQIVELTDEVTFAGKKSKLIDFLVAVDVVASRSEVRRLVSSNGIRVNGEVVTDSELLIKSMDRIDIGKTKSFRVKKG